MPPPLPVLTQLGASLRPQSAALFDTTAPRQSISVATHAEVEPSPLEENSIGSQSNSPTSPNSSEKQTPPSSPSLEGQRRPLTAQEWQSLKSCILPVLDGNCEFTQEWKNKWIPYVSSLGAEFGWDKCPNQLPKPKENMARPSSKGFNNAEKSRMEWNGILYLVLDKVPGGKLEFRTLCYVCIVLCPKLLRDSQKEGDTPTILVKRINSSARHSLSSHNEFVQEGKLWKIATIEGQEKKVELRKGKKESGLPPNAMRGMQISQVAESDSAARPSITFNQPPTESSKRKREDADRVANNHDASPKRKVLKTKTLPKTASDKSQSPTSDSAASQSNASQQPHKGLASTRPTFANGRHPLPGFPHYEQAKTPWGPNAEEEATGASRLEVAPSSETQNHNDGEPNLGTQRPRSCTPEQIEAIEALVHLARAHDEDDPVPSTLPRPRQMLAVEEIVGNRELLSMGGNWREPAVYTPNRTPSIQEERANRNGFRPNPQQEYHGKESNPQPASQDRSESVNPERDSAPNWEMDVVQKNRLHRYSMAFLLN